MPGNLDLLADVEPVWEELPGWETEIKQCRRIDDLPANARAYVDFMADLAGVPLTIVSVGPGREETIIV